jgi:hypothetical protein
MAFQSVTKESIFRQLEELPPNRLLEVAQFIEFLQTQIQQPARRKGAHRSSAFGIWADYSEAQDPASFAETLRHRMEMRQDA